MFDVTLLHLTRDLRVATPDRGLEELGTVGREQLLILLETFRNIDPVQNHDARPRILIRGAAGQVTVRTQRHRLFFDDDRRSHDEEGFEPIGLIEAISTGAGVPAHRSARRRPHGSTLVAFTLLAASVALDWVTFRKAMRYPSVEETAGVQPFTDPRELAAVTSAVHGRYVTGDEEGDREIVIDREGRVQFSRRTTDGTRIESEDRFRVGRSASGACLATQHSGVIEITNIDVIAYSGDVYRRK